MAPCVTQYKSQTLQLPIILLFKRDHNIDINWQFVRNVNCRTELPSENQNLHSHRLLSDVYAPGFSEVLTDRTWDDLSSLCGAHPLLLSHSPTLLQSLPSPCHSSNNGKHFHLAVPLDWNILPQVSLWLLPPLLQFFTQKSLFSN